MADSGFVARLKSVTKDGASRKMILFAGVAIVGAVVYALFPSEEGAAPPSNVVGTPRGAETIQGGNQLTPAYEEDLRRADELRKEQARQAGGTFVPTVTVDLEEKKVPVLIEEPENVPPEPPRIENPVPPPIEQRPIIVAPPVQQAPIVTPVAPIQNQQEVQKVTDYMNQIARPPFAVAEVQYMYREDDGRNVGSNTQSPPSVPNQQSSGAQDSKITLPLSGTIVYATLVGRANSDSPGPVIAKILQGPLSGATLVGSFTAGRDALVIKFNKLSLGTDSEGREINETVAIDAVAVDTQHIGTALATSVDRHLLQKIGISMASAFAEGFGRAIGQNNSVTTVRSDGSYTTSTSQLDTKDQLLSAGGHALASTGNILMDEFGRRPTTIIVEAGTPIGVLFL